MSARKPRPARRAGPTFGPWWRDFFACARRGGASCIIFFITLACAGAGPRGGSATSNGWQQQSFGGDGIKATLAVPGESILFGFVPVRVSIDNKQARDLRWQAEFTMSSFSGVGSTAARAALPVTAPAGLTGDRWVFVPIASSGPLRSYSGYFPSYGGIGVAISGTGIAASNLQFASGVGAARNNQMVPWAVSTAIEGAVRLRISALTMPATPGGTPRPSRRGAAPSTGSRPMVPGAPTLTSFDLTQPLPDWRIFGPFTRMIMGADEYAVLLPATKGALRNWVALGGSLYLFPEQRRDVVLEQWGAGRIITLARPIADDGDTAFGLFTQAGLFELTPIVPDANDLSLQSGYLPGKIPPEKRVGDWLVYFFIGFAALVAPINLLLIAPVRRRHWLFFSLPAISLAAVAVLVAAIYLQDGVAGEGARRTLVVLLPGENAAAVFQDQISRTGLLFRTSFPIAEDVACAAIPASGSNFQPNRVLQYDRQGGLAVGDWFRSRARQAQHLRRILPTRARIERVGQAPDGAPIVQSSVGAVVRGLIYVDGAGGSWTAERVPVGTPVTLHRLDGNGDYGRRVDDFAGQGSVHFGQLVREATLRPTPNRFVAFVEASELAPIPTLSVIDWKDSSVLLTGVVAGPNGGGAK